MSRTKQSAGTRSISYIESQVVGDLISSHRRRIIDLVADVYTGYYLKDAINPDTCSLRFPQKPEARINALPAYVGLGIDAAGIKWVASFPNNVKTNLQRASAVVILNSYETGYPIAIMDGSQISAARTAAGAVLAARLLRPDRRSRSATFVGAGVINRTVVDFLADDGWRCEHVAVDDPDHDSARALARYIESRDLAATVDVGASRRDGGPDLLCFATSALTPWYDRPIDASQIVLHLSLRDIVPGRLLGATNIVDDVGHALTAQTSLHLLEQQVGRTFHIDDYRSLLNHPGAERRGAVVAPFGIGVLDVALASLLFDEATDENVHTIERLLADGRRW